MSQSMALASLTATYTDSEGEDEANDDNENTGSVTVHSNSPDTKSTPTSRPGSPVQAKITSKVSRLVSYHDDTIVSDDDAEPNTEREPETMVIIENETPPIVETETIDEEGVNIPPEPPGHCSAEIQEKILRLHDRMQSEGLDMNMIIQQKKNFRNPSIYEKLIQFCSINELGTNYPPVIYDPSKWSKESYYEELSKVQKTEMEKREKERKTKVEVVSGTKKQEEEAKKRKSKWDQPGGNSINSHIKPAGLVQPSLTNTATGTKATVISAFGSLPKKPRA
ncbi:SAP30-binding protein [Onthophagus taurus]|uniref:SAP30-binding protein n=1 Tax=Onthophagus taurus TaxID=166361 RepID=UPI000C20E95E|nr:SAP30-binding protein [Onthophagus taurus]